LHDVYRRLLDHFGPQAWWPAETPFEVMVGAVLTQNTSWANVRRAIDQIREAGLLEPTALYKLDPEELAELIRPCGYFRLKAGRLRNLLRLVVEEYGGDVEAMLADDPDELRRALLAVNGIGPETADSILLYAAGRPTFVVDTYTHRVLARHGRIDFDAGYHDVQEYCTASLECDVQTYNELHALLVRVGHEHCRKRPRCAACPLADLLPDGRPLEPGE